jgi:CheY-like chemotaxis protein
MRSAAESSRMRIMVVEDSLDELQLLEYLAKTEDTIFAIKKGGISALQFLHDVNYDVNAVVLDLGLPDMNGFTLTAAIRNGENVRSKQRPIAIFWFTGWPFDENNPGDPLVIIQAKYSVARIFKKDVDIIDVIEEVKEYVNLWCK